MSSKHSSRTARRILQIASLGLAALIAGLLSGCLSSPKTASTDAYLYESTDQFVPRSASPSPSLDATSIPALRHPPSARRLQLESMPPNYPRPQPQARRPDRS